MEVKVLTKHGVVPLRRNGPLVTPLLMDPRKWYVANMYNYVTDVTAPWCTFRLPVRPAQHLPSMPGYYHLVCPDYAP